MLNGEPGFSFITTENILEYLIRYCGILTYAGDATGFEEVFGRFLRTLLDKPDGTPGDYYVLFYPGIGFEMDGYLFRPKYDYAMEAVQGCECVKLVGPQGERGSMLILDDSLTSTVLEDASQTASIVEALNFRPGDYTISYDTNTIYILNSSGDMFTKHNCLTPTQALIDEVTKKVTENLLMNWVDVYE